MISRLFDALRSFTSYIKSSRAENSLISYPKIRNFILDLMSEGKRKNIYHIFFEVDTTLLRHHIQQYSAQHNISLSLISYITKSLADTINKNKFLQAYRKGKSKLIIFNDVDISLMVEHTIDEHTIDEHMIPIGHILRHAQNKSALQINEEIQSLKNSSNQPGSIPSLLLWFFNLPLLLRKAVWF